MNISDLPEIFSTDKRVKTSIGYYYRHYINCGKDDCERCGKWEEGHPYWYYYPVQNPDNRVYYLGAPLTTRETILGIPYLNKIHIWGKIINTKPRTWKHIKGVILYNRSRKFVQGG